MTEAARTPKKGKLPDEVIAQLTRFNDALTALEDALQPHLDSTFEQHLERTPMDMARMDVMTMFAVNSLAWSTLAIEGHDPKEAMPLMHDLERTKTYVKRLRGIEERRAQPGLNQRAAAAFVRNALYELPEGEEKEKEQTEEGDAEPKQEEEEEEMAAVPAPPAKKKRKNKK